MNMSRREMIRNTGTTIGGVALGIGAMNRLAGAEDTPARDQPHILYIVADDLGWKDVGFNGSDVPIRDYMDDPVDPKIVETLKAHFPDFVKAYEPNGMTPVEFDTYGACVRTLRSFIGGYSDLLATIRDVMLPDAD